MPQPSISPDVLMYEPFSSAAPSSSAEANTARDSSQANASASFSGANNSAIGTQTLRSQPSPRCSFYRRLSMSNYHNAPNHYHSNLQNGNPYLRPAYAPHESLWYRQQNNQEIHRRHMMNSMSGTNGTNDSTASNSFGSYGGRVTTSLTNNAFCMQCDQQHPIGHPHRRVRQYVCGLNLVCIEATTNHSLNNNFDSLFSFFFFQFTESRKSTTFDCFAVIFAYQFVEKF